MCNLGMCSKKIIFSMTCTYMESAIVCTFGIFLKQNKKNYMYSEIVNMQAEYMFKENNIFEKKKTYLMLSNTM